MILEQNGVRVVVPERYPTYSDHVKQAIHRRVEWIREAHGDRLLTVYVDRVFRQDTERPRVDGGYCTR